MLVKKLAWLRRSQKKFLALDSDQAGSQGEELAWRQLTGLLKKVHGQARIFRSLRVPKYQGQGKYEIDLLLVSEVAVLVIEVKHWGGQLSRSKGSWVQERGSEKKTLPDPITINQDKTLALHRWLQQRGLAVPESCLGSIVLFTNDQASFSAELKKMAGVTNLPNFLDAAPEICSRPKGKALHKSASHYSFAAVIEALEQLPTWDRLELHGGRVMMGDLEYIVLPDVQPSALQRKYVRKATVHISRRLLPGLLLPAILQVRDWNGKRKVYPLHPDARLVFRLAGQNVKEEISWLNVVSLQLGWKDHSYYD